MRLTIELNSEDDGRYVAEVTELPGVIAYGDTEEETIKKVKELAIKAIAERIEIKIEVKSIRLNVIVFKDDEYYISYCPSLKLCGSGDTEAEALKSFEILLEEYIRDTTEDNTLVANLEKYGWKINKEDKKIVPPKMTKLLQEDNKLEDIINKYNFNQYRIPVQLPLVS
jgi:predicted RNase H-like HicB family nuclease